MVAVRLILFVLNHSFRGVFNQSGNQFVRGDDIALPKGVRFDNQYQLQVADIKVLVSLVFY